MYEQTHKNIGVDDSIRVTQWIESRAITGQSIGAILAELVASGWDADTARHRVESALTRAPPPVTLHLPRRNVVALPGPDLAEYPARIDVGDRQVEIALVMRQPRLILFRSLLSSAECARLIRAARPRLSRSQTVDYQTGGGVIHAARTSEGMSFEREETEFIATIDARIARLLRWSLRKGEGLQVLRYKTGTEFQPHHDFFDPSMPGSDVLLRRGGQRVGSLVIYLNTPRNGGATIFPETGIDIVPRTGSAVFFSYATPTADTRTLHGGAPVVSGEKWVATKWLRTDAFE